MSGNSRYDLQWESSSVLGVRVEVRLVIVLSDRNNSDNVSDRRHLD